MGKTKTDGSLSARVSARVKEFNIKVRKLQKVDAAMRKGLVPYVDFYPLNLNPNKKKTKTEQNWEDELISKKPLTSWIDLGDNAKHLYDNPVEALKILIKNSSLFKQTDHKVYMLCDLIEKTRNKKLNKGKALNKIVDEILPQCCTFIDVDYDNVDIAKIEMVRNMKRSDKELKKKYKQKKPGGMSRQGIIDRIIEKHRRLVIKKPKDFKDWIDNHKDPLKRYLTKSRLRTKVSK